MFYALTTSLLIYVAYVASREGGGVALRKSFLIAALLAPMWMTYNVRSIRLDFRIVQACLAFGFLLAFPPRYPLRLRPLFADFAIVGLVGSLCVSQYLSGSLAPLTPFDIAATWLPTYLVGRLYFQSADDVRRLAPFAVGVFCIAATLDVFEALASVNIVNAMFGKTFGILESGEGYRWGMKRAQGNLSHPIYNGYQLVLLLPLVIGAAVSCAQSGRRFRGLLVVPLVAAAVFVTVSRGAHLGFLIAITGTALLLLRRGRVVLLVLVISATTSVYSARHHVIEFLEAAVGQEREEVRTIMIDGEPVVYTGTKHRLLLLQVYRHPLNNAGWFGWGGSLKGVRIDPELEQRFGSIDSHYVLFFLQYGYVGMSLFVLVGVTSVVPLIGVGWKRGPWQPLAATTVAAMFAIAICLSSVWFAPDYGAVWLFAAGLSGNIRAVATAKEKKTETGRQTRGRHVVRRRIPVTQLQGAAA